MAAQNFKEIGDADHHDSQFYLTAVPDQRYKVVFAFARHDPAAARKLTDQMIQEEARDAANKPATDAAALKKTGEKLLTIAYTLVPSDPVAAVTFARSSLQFPATLQLPIFLYELARLNRPAANEFYKVALAAYDSAPMDQFLLLVVVSFWQ